MARHWSPTPRTEWFAPMTVRTSRERLTFLVCQLSGALVLHDGRTQHERWHRSTAGSAVDH
jgi:hypothetical protein